MYKFILTILFSLVLCPLAFTADETSNINDLCDKKANSDSHLEVNDFIENTKDLRNILDNSKTACESTLTEKEIKDLHIEATNILSRYFNNTEEEKLGLLMNNRSKELKEIIKNLPIDKRAQGAAHLSRFLKKANDHMANLLATKVKLNANNWTKDDEETLKKIFYEKKPRENLVDQYKTSFLEEFSPKFNQEEKDFINTQQHENFLEFQNSNNKEKKVLESIIHQSVLKKENYPFRYHSFVVSKKIIDGKEKIILMNYHDENPDKSWLSQANISVNQVKNSNIIVINTKTNAKRTTEIEEDENGYYQDVLDIYEKNIDYKILPVTDVGETAPPLKDLTFEHISSELLEENLLQKPQKEKLFDENFCQQSIDFDFDQFINSDVKKWQDFSLSDELKKYFQNEVIEESEKEKVEEKTYEDGSQEEELEGNQELEVSTDNNDADQTTTENSGEKVITPNSKTQESEEVVSEEDFNSENDNQLDIEHFTSDNIIENTFKESPKRKKIERGTYQCQFEISDFEIEELMTSDDEKYKDEGYLSSKLEEISNSNGFLKEEPKTEEEAKKLYSFFLATHKKQLIDDDELVEYLDQIGFTILCRSYNPDGRRRSSQSISGFFDSDDTKDSEEDEFDYEEMEGLSCLAHSNEGDSEFHVFPEIEFDFAGKTKNYTFSKPTHSCKIPGDYPYIEPSPVDYRQMRGPITNNPAIISPNQQRAMLQFTPRMSRSRLSVTTMMVH